jgi:hypothetical protein
LAPWAEISNDQLLDYYSHYLDAEYKHARTQLDPWYSSISSAHGSAAEFRLRRAQHTDYIRPFLDKYASQNNLSIVTLLDYGGGDGSIQPDFDLVRADTYDIGNDMEFDVDCDIVQCLHVLEHVGNPLSACELAFKHCKKGGMLYIEVPHEFIGIEKTLDGAVPRCDEHINKFSLQSMHGMLDALGATSSFLKRDLSKSFTSLSLSV